MWFDWLQLRRRPSEVLPTATTDQRGQIRMLTGDGSTTTDTLHFGRNDAGTMEWEEVAMSGDVTADIATHAALTEAHGATGAVVGTTNVQTLSDKTLNSAILGTDLDANAQDIADLGDVTFKTGAVGGTLRTGTSNADKFELQAYDVNSGVYRKVMEADAGNDVTLEVFADSFMVWDNTDETKRMKFTLSGGTTGVTTTVIHSPTANRSITLPDATDTLVGKATTDILTNKTLTTPTIGNFANATHSHVLISGGGQLDHTSALTNAGTNTHAQIDTHIASGATHTDLTLANTLEAAGSDPTIAAGAGAGATATALVNYGNDVAGDVQVTCTGGGYAAGQQIVVTFATARPDATYTVQLTPLSSDVALLGWYLTNRTTTTFAIAVKTAPILNDVIRFAYLVIEDA